MFGFFQNSSKAPISDEQRIWIESCFQWFCREFGADLVRSKRIMLPEPEYFPIDFCGSEENAFELLDIIAVQMDLDPDQIDINFYYEGQQEISTGAGAYARVFLRPAEGEGQAAGHYVGQDEDGCFQIGLNSRSLNNVEQLIATIAHELSHIKLLGEERIPQNNEQLTDLLMVIFGFGIFGANSATSFKTGAYSWSHGRSGYLSEMEWGYALAIHSHLRGEKSSDWQKYLRLNVRSDHKQSMKFINANREKVFSGK